MEMRIKPVKIKNTWQYALQVKKWIFWKTIENFYKLEDVERFLNTLKNIDEFNKNLKSIR